MGAAVTNRLSRSEVAIEQTWNLNDLYVSREAWQTALKKTLADFDAIKGYKGHSCESGTTLLACLLALETAYTDVVQIANYVMLREAEDGIDPVNQEDSMTFGAADTQINLAMSFLDSEVMALEEDAFKKLFTQEPKLEIFRLFLEDKYSKKKHMLLPKTEEALAALGELTGAPYGIYSMSKAADMTFDSFKDEQGNDVANSFALFEGKYEFASNAVVRGNAYESFTKTLGKYKNTYAAVYATEVKKQVALSRLRNYESVTHMLLEPHKVSVEMYENQLNIIYKELAPHMRRFAKLKEKQLGLEKIRFCDLKAPFDAEFNPSATYDSIRETIIGAVGVLGEDYQAIIKQAYNDRWIDYCDNIGKSTGAFCTTPYGSHPYILISYQDNMRSAFTLAHELGHAAHFVLTNKEQRIFDTEVSTYFVETPSTINEMFLGQYLMKQTEDPQMKRWVIMQLLGTYYHNFVTHLLEAEFQRRVYKMAEENISLTTKALCDTKLAVIRGFWGDAVEVDEAAGMTWMRQPHYYMGLYPYTYSAGLTASTAIAQQISEEGQPSVDKWLNVLKSGGTQKPEDLLKMVGIDMTTPAPIIKAVDYVGGLISQLEALYA